MLVDVRPFFSVRQALGGAQRLEIDLERPTIRDVLHELRRRYGEIFWRELFDPVSGQPLANTQILINGRHYRHLANQLDHALLPGEELAIFPATAGG